MATTTTRDLVARLVDLLRREHDEMAEFLVHLAEFDRLQGWRELGYAGLFPFAEAPRPLVPETSSQTVLLGEPTQSTCSAGPALAPVAPPRDEIVPMTGDRSRLHFSASRAFVEKLEAAKMALSHVEPGASMEQVFEAGLDLILAKDAKKKALVANPRPRKDPQLPYFDSRNLPDELRREVWTRDQGRCQFPMPGGGICGSTFQPEIDHVDGFQPGKPITAKDLRVCCDPHNDLHARQVFGDDYMDQFRSPRARRARRRRSGEPARFASVSPSSRRLPRSLYGPATRA